MQIYVVSRMIEDADGPVSANTISAHVDRFHADTAAQVIDHDQSAGYGVVETVELDLTGLPQDARLDLLDALARTKVSAP